MENYYDNILDIMDEWGGYPTEDVCNKPASNSGIVKLKCFINGSCPFYKTGKKEDGLIFNYLTFAELENYLQTGILNVLTTTDGLEGLHFKPRYLFRHNYMFQLKPGLKVEDVEGINTKDLYGDKFSNYYEEITTITSDSPPLNGAEATRYKAEQSWFVIESVFDNICSPSNINECGIQSSWNYQHQQTNDDETLERDLMLDYNTSYFNDYLDSFTAANLEAGPPPPMISRKITQMPTQHKTHNSKNCGVHWRVEKRTPLFKGEDFFIRFYKQSQETNVFNSTGKNLKIPFIDKDYSALDITSTEEVVIDPWILINNKPFKKFVNDALRFPSDTDKKDNDKAELYNFFTQAYYIIEIGKGNRKDHYFIIIPYRGNPLFVHFFQNKWAKTHVAKKLGEPFGGISGMALIRSDWFDVVVRNHLGRLSIQFRGDFKDPPPWIIERQDWVQSDVPKGETPWIEEEFVPLIVPHGRMSIWGGNIKTGFIFGPLQYQTDYISFTYPPRELSLEDGENEKSAWLTSKKEQVESSSYFQSNPFWLPLNRQAVADGDFLTQGKFFAEHEVLFSTGPPGLRDGMVGSEEPPYINKPLFTGDAQFYKEYDDRGKNKYKKGYFYYNEPIRAAPAVVAPGVKASRIVVTKYRFLNNFKTKHQGFDVFIGMMCGDHVFDGTSYYYALKDSDSYSLFGEYVPEDSSWYLPNCKTPIIPLLRLLSSVGDRPRWSDGTYLFEGVSRIPNSKISSYFVDASDHVTSFSHSWTATGLSQMEHSGSISFYLNRDFIGSENKIINNVTDYLLSLQDKTFYIEIWAGYESCNYSKIPGLYKMFTGICEGGSISYEYGKIIMNCKLEDYSSVLKGMKFFNSPWYDGMKDVSAINEILQLAGFRDQGLYDPGSLIRVLNNRAIAGGSSLFFAHIDGRVFKHEPFVLPSGYNRLEQPGFKFKDGDPYIDAITKISKLSSKIFYFDEFGIAHFEDYQDMVEKDFLGEVPLVPLYHFTTNPSEVSGQMIFNKMERSFDVASVHNHIKVLSNTPDMHLLIGDHLSWESIVNPDSAGFLGYQRTFYQQESMIGSSMAQKFTVRKYSVAFRPKIMISFETYGLPLRATDVVSIGGISSASDVEGNAILDIVRVVKVNHTFDPLKNRWWMEVGCERYQPISTSIE